MRIQINILLYLAKFLLQLLYLILINALKLALSVFPIQIKVFSPIFCFLNQYYLYQNRFPVFYLQQQTLSVSLTVLSNAASVMCYFRGNPLAPRPIGP